MPTLVEYSPRLQRAVDNALRGSSTSRMPPHRPGREIGTEARPSEGGATLAYINRMTGDYLDCTLYENGASNPPTGGAKVFIPQAELTGLTPGGWILAFPVTVGSGNIWSDEA